MAMQVVACLNILLWYLTRFDGVFFAHVLVIVNLVSVMPLWELRVKSGGGSALGCPASGDCHVAHKMKDQSSKTRDLSFGLILVLTKKLPWFQSVLTSELKAGADDSPAHINCSLGFSVAFLSNCDECENGSGGANGCTFCFSLAGSRYESVVCFDMVRSFTWETKCNF